MRGCAARGGGGGGGGGRARERKRFYTLNGADKLYHMAFMFFCLLYFFFVVSLSLSFSPVRDRRSSKEMKPIWISAVYGLVKGDGVLYSRFGSFLYSFFFSAHFDGV